MLCLTKSDLADPEPFAAQYRELGVPVLVTGRSSPGRRAGWTRCARSCPGGCARSSGTRGRQVHAGQRDRPGCDPGHRAGVGRRQGRHTTTAALAFPHADGWVVDTPGVRSFGLAHVSADDVVAAFGDLADAIEDCPRGCGHLGPPADPECALDDLVASGALEGGRLDALRRVLVALASDRF